MSKTIFVNELDVDCDVQDFFMVKSISIRTGSNKKMYLDVILGDKTGEINGKKWDVSDEESAVLGIIREGDIVNIRATVSEWNGSRQLKIFRIKPRQSNDDVEMMDFVKAAPEDPTDMFNYILDRASSIKDELLRAAAEKFLNDNKKKLLYYPAAMRNHHAELAGLLYHIKRMLTMGEKACDVYDFLDRDWVVCGVILHDMEKLNEIESNELGISPGYTFEGQLLGHIAQGVKAVDRLAESVGMDSERAVMLEHMILSHHYEPEFGSPRKPLFPEAELLHYLDMVDAKLFDFEDALSATPAGQFSDRVRTLDGRMLYKPTFK